jgi:phage baseplate assembly protein W|tara:strand:- start:1963 stop:2343 length:381 start_codon:yes stop_codon:yes gene_type:complete
MVIGYSAKLPLAYTKDDGPYLLTKDLTENTKQNFKNLVLTNPGERVMEPDFGVGFTQLLFENANEDTVEDLKERLFIQVKKYLPFVEIQTVETQVRENTAYLRVDYIIPALSVSETLELDIDNNFG